MKEKLLPIFKERVCEIWGCSDEQFFDKTNLDFVDTRQMVAVLAHHRNIPTIKVTRYFNEHGAKYNFSITNSSMAKGVKSMWRKIESDTDLRIIFNKLKDERIV